jgi:ribosomal protein S18 acetylase RimI-like enzyme
MIILQAERITPEKADAVHRILSECGRDLSTHHGFSNWDPPLPVDRIRADALEREVYLFCQGADAIATLTLGMSASIPYEHTVRWSPGISCAVYVNRLAVLPHAQGRGHGRSCMCFAEERARQLGARAARCDVLEANEPLRRFYENLGYRSMGEREHSGWRFACYEKVL